MGTRISLRRPDGKQAEGYLAKAARANAPGVVVIQEWWGLQEQIKGVCDRLALAGYEALAPDLYAGTVVAYHDTAAAEREMNSLNFLDVADQVIVLSSGAAVFRGSAAQAKAEHSLFATFLGMPEEIAT